MMVPGDVDAHGSVEKNLVASSTIQARPGHAPSVLSSGEEQQAEKSGEHSWTCDEESDGGVTPTNDEPINSMPQLQRWNSPRINAFRTLATFWDFMILGANDAAYG